MSDSYPPDYSPAEIAQLRRAAKEGLRQRLAGLRRALSAEARRERSEAMCALLSELPELKAARVISAYVPLKFEIDPMPVVNTALAQGKVIALPRVVPQTRQLTLHRYAEGDALEESGFAVREPLPSAPEIDLSSVDVVLVPGLGFDERGGRLGYGQGFYDRLLPRLPRALRVGLCFELSMLVEVPTSETDVPVDVIVSCRRVIRCSR